MERYNININLLMLFFLFIFAFMNNEVLFSEKTDNWSTPKDLYNKLDVEFNFDFDPCPLRSDEDGLGKDWIGNIFINPPYSNVGAFLQKGIQELEKENTKILVYLLASRTDTKWQQNLVFPNAKYITFIRGRLKFGNSKNSAPFPSQIIIICKENLKQNQIDILQQIGYTIKLK